MQILTYKDMKTFMHNKTYWSNKTTKHEIHDNYKALQ
jgi:hypothetical protein